MKSLIFVVLALFLASSINAEDTLAVRALPQVCEDVLSPMVCNKLRGVAQALKLKVEEVDAAVRDAVARGKTRTLEVVASVKEFLQNKVLNKKCEDFLPLARCLKLRAIAAALKLKVAEVKVMVRLAIVQGKLKVDEVVTAVKDFMRNKVLNKTCEDILPVDRCASLRKLAANIKVNMLKVQQMVIEKVLEGSIKTIEIYEKVVAYLRQVLARRSCEDFLSTKVCERIRKVASAVGVAVDKVENAIKNAIMKGVTRVSEIYTAILKFLKDQVLGRIKGLIPGKRSLEKRGLSETLEQIKAKIAAGVAKAKALLKLAVQKILEDYKIANQKVREAIEKAIVEGKIRISEVRAKIQEYLKQLLGKGENVESQAVSHAEFRRDIRDQLKEALQKAHGYIKVVIQKALAGGQEALAQIKDLLQKLLQQLVGDKQRRSYDESFEQMNEMAELALSEAREQAASDAEIETESAIDEAVRETEDLIDDVTSVEKRDLSDKLAQLREVFKQIGAKLGDIIKNVSVRDIINSMKKAGGNMVAVAKDLLEKIKNMQSGSSVY